MIAASKPVLALRSPPNGCEDRSDISDCDSCGARALSICRGVERDDLMRLGDLAQALRLKAGAVLIREGDPAPFVFNITSGSVRVYKLLPDGRRQITGFLFAGDFLGLAIATPMSSRPRPSNRPPYAASRRWPSGPLSSNRTRWSICC